MNIPLIFTIQVFVSKQVQYGILPSHLCNYQVSFGDKYSSLGERVVREEENSGSTQPITVISHTHPLDSASRPSYISWTQQWWDMVLCLLLAF